MSSEIKVLVHQIENLEDPIYAICLDRMNDDFKKNIGKFKYQKDKIKKLSSKLMLQKALKDSGWNLDISKVIIRNKHGKPHIKFWNGFNISYSGGIVVLAISNSRSIGIDIECQKPVDIQLMRPLFHENEWKLLENSLNPTLQFYDLWVKKEALVKAEGVGLKDDLHFMDCTTSSSNYFTDLWHFSKLNIQEGYTCYLCTDFIPERIQIVPLTIKQLSEQFHS